MRTSTFIINLLLICSTALFGQNSISLVDNSDGTWNVDYSANDDFGGNTSIL